jgi:hypothetical protein
VIVIISLDTGQARKTLLSRKNQKYAMKKTGTANLPLHPGKCPKWLFPRMVFMSREISKFIIYEYGENEFLKRISDPYFFQSLGNVVGFDWHSSGLTTTLCGALKAGLSPDFGIVALGGKGRASKNTPLEIQKACDDFGISTQKSENLVYASRMSAKVDNALVQDGFQLYHHSFFLSESGNYAVVQQGMNPIERYARRYHWLFGFPCFVEEPHSGICADKKEENVLDLTSKESRECRKTSVDLSKEKPEKIFRLCRNLSSDQHSIMEYTGEFRRISMPASHLIPQMKERDLATLKKAYEIQPESYEKLVSIKGFGAKAVRALALISEIIYGSETSWKDPAKYSFAHGGKDGIPYPVNRELMDENSELLRDAIKSAKSGDLEKRNALYRLSRFYA